MWSRLYRNYLIMAFPTYDTIANAWAPQSDINWFAGSSHDSKFVQFSKRCATEEEAVTWALRRSELWVDNRLRRLSRAILPKRDGMIEAAKSHLGKVTPEQPVSARSSTEPGPEKNIDGLSVQVRLRRKRVKTQRQEFAEGHAALTKPSNHDHWSRLETRRKLEHTRQDLRAAVLPRAAHIPLRQRPWRRFS